MTVYAAMSENADRLYGDDHIGHNLTAHNYIHALASCPPSDHYGEAAVVAFQYSATSAAQADVATEPPPPAPEVFKKKTVNRFAKR